MQTRGAQIHVGRTKVFKRSVNSVIRQNNHTIRVSLGYNSTYKVTLDFIKEIHAL